MKKVIKNIVCIFILISILLSNSIVASAGGNVKIGKVSMKKGLYVDLQNDSKLVLNKKTCKFTTSNENFKINKNAKYKIKKFKFSDFEGGIENPRIYDGIELNLKDKNMSSLILFCGGKKIFFNPHTGDSFIKAPGKVQIKLKKGKKYVKVSWNKAKWPKKSIKSLYEGWYGNNNDYYIGYEIQYSTDKKFKKKTIKRVYSENKTSIKITNLKKNKKYYFRVRSFVIMSPRWKDKSYFSFNSFSKKKSIKSPKKCKYKKNPSLKTIKKKVKKTLIKKYNCIDRVGGYFFEYREKTNLYGKEYYAFTFEYPLGYRYYTVFILVSVDGDEFLNCTIDYNYDYTKIYYKIYF